MKVEKSRSRICPHCKSSRAIRIIYGLPDLELAKEEAEGKLVLGGCCLVGDGSDPRWECRSCGTRWK